jgi:hypothetical protein
MVLQLCVSETDVVRSRRHFSFTHPESATVANEQFEKPPPNSERYSLPLNMATGGMNLTSALEQTTTVKSSPNSHKFLSTRFRFPSRLTFFLWLAYYSADSRTLQHFIRVPVCSLYQISL